MIAAALALLAAAPVECWHARRLGRADEARACFEQLILSRRLSDKAEGAWGSGLYKEANDAFRQAVNDDPKNAALRVRWGRFLADRYSTDDAAGLFNEALGIEKDYPPALFGLALVFSENWDRRAMELARKTLEKAPKMVEARELLASLLLEDGDRQAAAAEARKALEDSREAMDAMAVLASVDLLEDKPSTEWTARMLSVNAHYGEGLARIARHFVLNRRYEEAIAHYTRAVELDPEYMPALSELGINLMRVGRDVEAQAALAKAYNAGYRNAATSNSLNLLDTLQKFVTFKDERFVLRLDKREADLLRPYVEREILRAMAVYEKKYGVKLAGPVMVEMYPNHGDFEVRTLGMPGLGALGVTFGLSVAMDSPSARKPGSFHWAATLWHELAHVYVLAATRHRVPRWFTEGLSVYEESATMPEWAEPVTPEIAAALKKGALLPVAQLDRGFIRPAYPAQVPVSYFQAGQICAYINERWGWAKIRELITAFSRVTTTAEVVESVLGMKAEEFDKQFLAWLGARKLREGKLEVDVEAVKKRAGELAEKGEMKDAEKMLSGLLWVYPVKDEELHRRLAETRAKLGLWDDAADEWRAVVHSKTVDPASAHYGLALALKEQKKLEEAKDAVLAALEAAPGYRPAQKLLLELNRKE